MIHEVTGVGAGIWVLQPAKRRLVQHPIRQDRTETQQLVCGRPCTEPHQPSVFCVANIHRLMMESGPDLYRLAHIEAGTSAHRLYLAASSLGLGCHMTGTFFDEDIRRFIGIERTGWEILYAMALGQRTPNAGGPAGKRRIMKIKSGLVNVHSRELNRFLIECRVERRSQSWHFIPFLIADDTPGPEVGWIIAGIVVVIGFLIVFRLLAQFIGLYIRARVSGAPVRHDRSDRHAAAEGQRQPRSSTRASRPVRAGLDMSRSPRWRRTSWPAATCSASSTR